MTKEREQLWYKDDQWSVQYAKTWQRINIQKRWDLFEKYITTHHTPKDEVVQVLDLGCGDGINIKGITEILKKHGIKYQLKGVDYNPTRLERVKERFPEVQTGSFDLIKDESPQKYDIIIFNHVLEHIPEDEKALENLHKLLSEGGVL